MTIASFKTNLKYGLGYSNSVVQSQQLESSSKSMGPMNGVINSSNASLASRQRLRWTNELHERFEDAVTQLGGPDSTKSEKKDDDNQISGPESSS
ncbi:hypothetical protein B296_00023583 [Ensete ventricosum]|uniref:MYB-CC type transcription factor LHEQLE-containing domain-containing protein n=1 Tax=Ensete ventricosum TaxID=4639 RepID=A0A426Y1B8_ENSVE|nr:hypothetical protein B296_00023583 [Ensete ventricosum]